MPRSSRKFYSAFTIILSLSVILLLLYSLIEKHNSFYIVTSLCLLFACILLAIAYARNKLNLFSQITVFSIFYLSLYFIAPIHDVLFGIDTWFGYELFTYGEEGSLIALIGYISFLFAFVINFKRDTQSCAFRVTNVSKRMFECILLLMYGVFLSANMYYIMRYSGHSALYVITLGLLGDGNMHKSSAPIDYISMFSWCLPGTTLLYWEYGKNKQLKILLFIPMLMLQVARGFRFAILQTAISCFAYYYLKKKSSPSLSTLVVVLSGIMIPILLMTVFRVSIRGGHGMDLSIIDLNLIESAFESAVWENFRIYQNFYGMLPVIPEKYDFVYGRQIIIGTLVMLVPRAIWPDKLSCYGGEGLKTLIGSNVASGQAYPNLGEFYYSGGVLGIMLFMFLHGLLLNYATQKFNTPRSCGYHTIIYAIILGCNLQLIIRGYTPSNFWLVVFSLLPLLLILPFLKKEYV